MDDLLCLDHQLTIDEKMIRDSVAQFVKQDILPNIAEYFEHAVFPQDVIKKIAELGMLGLTLPEHYGGAAASYIAYGLLCQELERGDSGLRSFVSVQNSLGIYPIFRSLEN